MVWAFVPGCVKINEGARMGASFSCPSRSSPVPFADTLSVGSCVVKRKVPPSYWDSLSSLIHNQTFFTLSEEKAMCLMNWIKVWYFYSEGPIKKGLLWRKNWTICAGLIVFHCIKHVVRKNAPDKHIVSLKAGPAHLSARYYLTGHRLSSSGRNPRSGKIGFN